MHVLLETDTAGFTARILQLGIIFKFNHAIPYWMRFRGDTAGIDYTPNVYIANQAIYLRYIPSIFASLIRPSCL